VVGCRGGQISIRHSSWPETLVKLVSWQYPPLPIGFVVDLGSVKTPEEDAGPMDATLRRWAAAWFGPSEYERINMLPPPSDSVRALFETMLDLADPYPTPLWAAKELAKQEAAARTTVNLVAENAKARRHNATCARCFGPAYHGFGYAPACEREGGCLAEREPVVNEGHPAIDDTPPLGADVWMAGCWSDDWTRRIPENGWTHALAAVDGEETEGWATRDLAVAAWRERLLARAKEGAL